VIFVAGFGVRFRRTVEGFSREIEILSYDGYI
jgi:hypothetical protein